MACDSCKVPIGERAVLTPDVGTTAICIVCGDERQGDSFIATHLGFSDTMVPLCHAYKRDIPRVCPNCKHVGHYAFIPCDQGGLHNVTAEFATVTEAIGIEIGE